MDRKRKSSNSTISNLDLLSRTKAEKLFQKKASYVKDKEWHLPNPQAVGSTGPVWTVTELQDLKLKLNNLKDKLSDKEISEWHSHTQFMNFAGNIVQDVRQQLHPELCTQAWCKFYEIISTYDLVDFDSSNFNTVHLCEAPGAFVTSLNHFLISNDYRGTWTWYANTLNPWYEGNSVGEMIDDDHFIRDTADYWYFGPDNTGNIMDLNNLKCLVEKCQEMGNIHLVCLFMVTQDLLSFSITIVFRNLYYCMAPSIFLPCVVTGSMWNGYRQNGKPRNLILTTKDHRYDRKNPIDFYVQRSRAQLN